MSDLELMTSPIVSSNRFKICIHIKFSFYFNGLSFDKTIHHVANATNLFHNPFALKCTSYFSPELTALYHLLYRVSFKCTHISTTFLLYVLIPHAISSPQNSTKLWPSKWMIYRFLPYILIIIRHVNFYVLFSNPMVIHFDFPTKKKNYLIKD